MSYSHEIEKEPEKDTYEITLCKRNYFLRKKIGTVLNGVSDYETAKSLTNLLDRALKCGMELEQNKRSSQNG